MKNLLDNIPFFKKNSRNTAGNDSDNFDELQAILPDQVGEEREIDISDVIAPSAIRVNPTDLEIGDKLVRSYYIISYPRYLNEGWFAPIINIDKVVDVSIFVHPVDTSQILKKFQKRVAEVQSQIMAREESGQVRDPKLDAAYQNLENLRDQLLQAEEKLFDVGLYLSIYGRDKKELDKVEKEIKTILEAKVVYMKPAVFQEEQGFKSVAPLGTDLLEVHSKLNSSPLSSIFPFVSFDLSSDKGILYGINRHNSSLILFDRFSMPNYNSITFATSGAGKSYMTKLEILRTLMFDTEVIIMDPEREYEYLAEAVGGRTFNISLSSEHTINPFDIPTPTAEESFSNVLRSHVIFLIGLVRLMVDGLDAEQESLVDAAITETYALKDITTESDYDPSVEPPLLSDFEMVLRGIEGGEEIATKLSKYTTGSWSGFINAPTNVDINKKLVVFSLRDMEEDLKPVAMYIVTSHIWRAVRTRLQKRLLVIDEAWWMMRSEDTASFLLSMAKRGRKYYLGIATITQDVGDFLQSEYGIPIITNSSVQILLKQSPTTIDKLQETFNLTDEEKYLLMESNVGEGIFFAGTKHVAVKVIASYTEDQIITSDPAEILKMQESRAALAAEGGGML